jgi:lipoprotein-anchoring transpeptidase ErfK/SrfK
MKNLFWLLAFTFAISQTGCGRAEMGNNASEPPTEVLEKEQATAPMAEDGPLRPNSHLSPDAQKPTQVPSGKIVPPVCLGDKLESDLSPYGFEIVILIDKSTTGQTMRVLQNGTEIYAWKTSTGLEDPRENKLGDISEMHTPTGFFTPIPGRLYENYHSKSWDSDMPFALFFAGGVAIHETSKNNYEALGTRASGGCVRLNHENAQTLFQLVKNDIGRGTIAQFDRDTGCLKQDKNGKTRMTSGYKTLIVVHE